MNQDKSYFFCGIGGSGMLPLALILRGKGIAVAGSDRSLDQGRMTQKFAFLRAQGISLYPQDGSGMTRADQTLVTSAAVEESVPDVKAARAIGAPLMSRAALLAQLFNAAPRSVAIGGTSGKSTVTGMAGWILYKTGRDPTIMNGAVMKNFMTPDRPFASAVVGKSDVFISEVDESDGSIAQYTPHIAVLNNVAFDHRSLDELRILFSDFIGKAERVVLNLDNEETARLTAGLPRDRVITYSLSDGGADLFGRDLRPRPDGIDFHVAGLDIRLQVPGRHNVSNALAAIGAARALDVPLDEAAATLASFSGIKRRLELVGTAGAITVIDDFAHNPDKLTASLETLHSFPGRLLVMFQPHGFGPLKLMKDAFIACFVEKLGTDDVLVMPDPVYFGGTVDRSVTSADLVAGVRAGGRQAFAFADRAECGETLLALARPGDRIVVMGARDDTLSQFAQELLQRLG